MITAVRCLRAAACILLVTATAAEGQRPDAATLIAAQKEAMKSLTSLDGAWRGNAWTLLENGQKQEVVQTERVGSFLDGSIKVIEGRGYDPATGQVIYNAFAIVSYDAMRKTYSLHSYSQGFSGDFKLSPTADGYIWEIPAGPMTIRYTVVLKDGTWHEVGDRIIAGQEPVRFMEMTLKRIAATDWPAAGAIPRQ